MLSHTLTLVAVTPQTAFGEALKVVGSLAQLGAWEVDAAPAMHWQDGDFWNVDVTLPAGEAFEAKLVHLSAHAVTWEPGRNRCGRPVSQNTRCSNGAVAAARLLTGGRSTLAPPHKAYVLK